MSDPVVREDSLDECEGEHTIKLPFPFSFSHSEKCSCHEREKRDRFDCEVWWKVGDDFRVGEMLVTLC